MFPQHEQARRLYCQFGLSLASRKLLLLRAGAVDAEPAACGVGTMDGLEGTQPLEAHHSSTLLPP